MADLIETYGLALLFLLIALESAGVPLPGETALIAAAIAASQDRFPHVAWVIVVAAAAAILGDNGGYWLGRKGGRKLLHRWKRLERFSERVLPPSERFFAKHGAKTVFFGRFVAILRITSAWLAGVSRMEWWRFLLWNAAGGIVWAAGVALLAFYFGHAAADAVQRFGYLAAGAIAVLAIPAFLAVRWWKRRLGLDEKLGPGSGAGEVEG